MPRLTSMLRPLVISMGLATASCASMAAISTNADSFELFLVVADQANAKMSYTLDLGVNAMDFWVQGQQDIGASLFRTIKPGEDEAFKAFIDAANPSTTNWMIATFSKNPVEGSRTVFSTLTNNNTVATQTKSFDNMKALDSGDMTSAIPAYADYLSTLNSAGPAQILKSTHNSAANGSSVASKNAGNTSTYLSRSVGFGDSASGNSDGTCMLAYLVCAGNPVGVSSWFYRLTPVLVTVGKPEDGVDAAPVIVDEFDNLGADGYWGFIKDPNSSNYILSYTLNGANPKVLVSTDAGRTRQSFVDYSAQSGIARLIGGIGADDVAFRPSAAVSAVPEPTGWMLMVIGLLGVAAACRAELPRRGC